MGAPAKSSKLDMSGNQRTTKNAYPMKVKAGGAGAEKLPKATAPANTGPAFKTGGKIGGGVNLKLGSKGKQLGIDGPKKGVANKLPMRGK